MRDWLRTGPLQPATSRSADTSRTQDSIAAATAAGILSRATEVGTTVGHIVAGFFIVLFGTYFFLADGTADLDLVRAALPARRARCGSTPRAGSRWISLTQFVRATVLVAAHRRHRRS